MQTAIDKIRELRALHDDGLLSGEEFEQRKNAVLDAVLATEHSPNEPAAGGPARTELGLMEGQHVGPANRRYRLERLIAPGGMGQVWQATDLATHASLGHSARVALKILSPELTESSNHARLLVEEATRARRLAHEHIVRVYDWAQDPATASFFLIMECLEGEDAGSLLAREGHLPLERVLALLAPIGEALDYAWAKHRLVHRDIKPANLFVTAHGEVKLLDFGIAARARAGPDAGTQALEAPARSGTPGYRAPEAGAAGSVPAPSLDVYSVAAMIHQMLSSRAPVAGGAFQQPDGLPDAQWAVLRCGLADAPERRQRSVSQLLAQLASPPQLEPVELTEPATPAEDLPLAEPEPALADEAADLAQAQAAADIRAAVVRLRREQEKRERVQLDAARRLRREALREQLALRRAEEVAKTRQAQDEAQRKALQARAAAAYLAEQERARVQAIPAPAPAAGVVTAASAGSAVSAAPDTTSAPAPVLLRDRFLDGSGAGPELVLIQAGRFQMGSPEHERKIAMAAGAQESWLARETPQHWVGIERPFALGRYPVTVGEWRAFVEATGWQPNGDVDWSAPGFVQLDTHPVVGVSWGDAQLYLDWLSQASGTRYRLPSEAEWEYACRAGTRTAFSFGDNIDPSLANYDGNFSWNGGAHGDYRRGTTPVTLFAANPWGLHDMHGNVWEWVQDVMHDNYEGAPLDGSAWEESSRSAPRGGERGGNRPRRVLRGGCWLYNPRYLRSALRNAFSAVMSNDIVGFRVARNVDIS